MAMAPEPTDEDTRFVAPLRTSPTAKTPGMLVSTKPGAGDHLVVVAEAALEVGRQVLALALVV
jgi:hypothetical protein